MKDKRKTEKSKEEKQTIKCDVDTCTHNNGKNHCNLEEIQISSEVDTVYDEIEEKEETICNDFEIKDEDIDTTDKEEDI